MTTVTATDFQNKVGSFFDEPLKEPVYITKLGKRVAVLVEAAEWEHLITLADNRQSHLVKDLPADAIKELKNGPQAPSRPELDHLMIDK